MANGNYTIISNELVAKNVYEMRIDGLMGVIPCPGQFINIQIGGCYLRRPFSLADWDDTGMLIFYKIAGEGTRRLSSYKPGQEINALTGLGHGFDASASKQPLLIGGGVGVPPLYALAKRFASNGIFPRVLLGFASTDDVILAERFRVIGCDPDITLETDGLRVTDRLDRHAPSCDEYFACGPEGMLRAIHSRLDMPGQLSLETRMACGVGLCMGCTCITKLGGKRICTDGPVLRKEALAW